MSTIKQALLRVASEVPESRQFIIPLLQRHATCACGDERLAGELDEMMGGRKFNPHDPSTNKDYAKNVKDPGKWLGDNKGKGKCYYETGDPKDRCYVTTNGGPGGQTKPDTGSAKNKGEYNKKYVQQRWPGGVDRSKYKNKEATVNRTAVFARMAKIQADIRQLRQKQAGDTTWVHKAYSALMMGKEAPPDTAKKLAQLLSGLGTHSWDQAEKGPGGGKDLPHVHAKVSMALKRGDLKTALVTTANLLTALQKAGVKVGAMGPDSMGRNWKRKENARLAELRAQRMASGMSLEDGLDAVQDAGFLASRIWKGQRLYVGKKSRGKEIPFGYYDGRVMQFESGVTSFDRKAILKALGL